jgi:integrase
MATVNFLYRSNKPEAKLILRLLFRISDLPSKVMNKTTKQLVEYSYTDYVIAENTKISVSKEYWSKHHKAQRISDTNIINTRTEVNNKINEISTFVLNEFEKYNPTEINKKWLTDKIDNFYNPKKNEVIPTDLVSFFDYYINYRKNDLSKALFLKNNTIRDKLKEMQIFRKQTIYITDVNELFMNEFVDYYKYKNYAHNTAQREFGFIKTVCKKAKFLGLEISHQLDALTIKPKEVKNIHLTFEELDKINTTEFKSVKTKTATYTYKELVDAKDWLIISAYSGQRISDFMRFSNEMIKIRDGKKFLAFTQQKTNTKMIISIHNKILEILEKRGSNFPDRINDQRYNLLLKEICKQAEINTIVEGGLLINGRKVDSEYPKYQLVSSHIGRRSFATNFYGILKTNQLKNMTGHSTEKMLLTYIGDTSDDDAKEISKIFSFQ